MNICIVDPYENIISKIERIAAFKDPFIRVPLMDDVTIVAESNLNALREQIGGIGDIVSTVASLEQATSGQSIASQSAVNISTKLGAPQWTINSTKPIEVQVKLGFFSEVQTEKPLNTASGLVSAAVSAGASNIAQGNYQPGHWIHTLNKLVSYSILSIGADGKFIVPGVGLKDLETVSAELKEKAVPDFNIFESISNDFNPLGGLKKPRINTISKLVRFSIPGIIDIPIAVIPRCTVTYSKQITDLGYPLWATAEVQVQGIIPAMASDFTSGANLGKQLIATKIF